jgi:CheY-like chemotaxis protein
VRQNLGIMASEGERLTSMINDVLDLAKIEAGKLEWRSEPVALGEVVDQAAKAATPLVEQAGLRLDLDLPPDLPEVLGDRNRLVQVVLNLLSNAVKFTPTGSVTIRARTSGEDVQVDVIDTGVGIAPEDQGRVFEQFGQAGDTLTDKPRGTGLGLPICRQIVTHHGGRLWLDSTQGGGSTFSFTLPAHARPDDAVGGAEPETAPAEDGRELEPAVAGVAAPLATVLLVEDDPATRELVRQAIEPCRARLLEAGDGETGLAMAREAQPALVILDVLLPGMDGFEVARALRSDPATASVRVMMLTISTERERAEELAVDRFIEKPIDPDRLALEVSALLPPAVPALAEATPTAR